MSKASKCTQLPIDGPQVHSSRITEEHILRRCGKCSAREPSENCFSRCSQCKQTYYCSRNCQRDDYYTGHSFCVLQHLSSCFQTCPSPTASLVKQAIKLLHHLPANCQYLPAARLIHSATVLSPYPISAPTYTPWLEQSLADAVLNSIVACTNVLNNSTDSSLFIDQCNKMELPLAADMFSASLAWCLETMCPWAIHCHKLSQTKFSLFLASAVKVMAKAVDIKVALHICMPEAGSTQSVKCLLRQLLGPDLGAYEGYVPGKGFFALAGAIAAAADKLQGAGSETGIPVVLGALQRRLHDESVMTPLAIQQVAMLCGSGACGGRWIGQLNGPYATLLHTWLISGLLHLEHLEAICSQTSLLRLISHEFERFAASPSSISLDSGEVPVPEDVLYTALATPANQLSACLSMVKAMAHGAAAHGSWKALDMLVVPELAEAVVALVDALMLHIQQADVTDTLWPDTLLERALEVLVLLCEMPAGQTAVTKSNRLCPWLCTVSALNHEQQLLLWQLAASTTTCGTFHVGCGSWVQISEVMGAAYDQLGAQRRLALDAQQQENFKAAMQQIKQSSAALEESFLMALDPAQDINLQELCAKFLGAIHIPEPMAASLVPTLLHLFVRPLPSTRPALPPAWSSSHLASRSITSVMCDIGWAVERSCIDGDFATASIPHIVHFLQGLWGAPPLQRSAAVALSSVLQSILCNYPKVCGPLFTRGNLPTLLVPYLSSPHLYTAACAARVICKTFDNISTLTNPAPASSFKQPLHAWNPEPGAPMYDWNLQHMLRTQSPEWLADETSSVFAPLSDVPGLLHGVLEAVLLQPVMFSLLQHGMRHCPEGAEDEDDQAAILMLLGHVAVHWNAAQWRALISLSPFWEAMGAMAAQPWEDDLEGVTSPARDLVVTVWQLGYDPIYRQLLEAVGVEAVEKLCVKLRPGLQAVADFESSSSVDMRALQKWLRWAAGRIVRKKQGARTGPLLMGQLAGVFGVYSATAAAVSNPTSRAASASAGHGPSPSKKASTSVAGAAGRSREAHWQDFSGCAVPLRVMSLVLDAPDAKAFEEWRKALQDFTLWVAAAAAVADTSAPATVKRAAEALLLRLVRLQPSGRVVRLGAADLKHYWGAVKAARAGLQYMLDTGKWKGNLADLANSALCACGATRNHGGCAMAAGPIKVPGLLLLGRADVVKHLDDEEIWGWLAGREELWREVACLLKDPHDAIVREPQGEAGGNLVMALLAWAVSRPSQDVGAVVGILQGVLQAVASGSWAGGTDLDMKERASVLLSRQSAVRAPLPKPAEKQAGVRSSSTSRLHGVSATAGPSASQAQASSASAVGAGCSGAKEGMGAGDVGGPRGMDEAGAAARLGDGGRDSGDLDWKCGRCGVEKNEMFLCSGCRAVRYCSTECQRLHWKAHRKVCKQQHAAA